jgi:hypothetical protein
VSFSTHTQPLRLLFFVHIAVFDLILSASYLPVCLAGETCQRLVLLNGHVAVHMCVGPVYLNVSSSRMRSVKSTGKSQKLANVANS